MLKTSLSGLLFLPKAPWTFIFQQCSPCKLSKAHFLDSIKLRLKDEDEYKKIDR